VSTTAATYLLPFGLWHHHSEVSEPKRVLFIKNGTDRPYWFHSFSGRGTEPNRKSKITSADLY